MCNLSFKPEIDVLTHGKAYSVFKVDSRDDDDSITSENTDVKVYLTSHHFGNIHLGTYGAQL